MAVKLELYFNFFSLLAFLWQQIASYVLLIIIIKIIHEMNRRIMPIVDCIHFIVRVSFVTSHRCQSV